MDNPARQHNDPFLALKRTSASWNHDAIGLKHSVAHQAGDMVRTTRYSALPLIILS